MWELNSCEKRTLILRLLSTFTTHFHGRVSSGLLASGKLNASKVLHVHGTHVQNTEHTMNAMTLHWGGGGALRISADKPKHVHTLTRILQNNSQFSKYLRVPLLCDYRPLGRKHGAGICAQQETNSQRQGEGRKTWGGGREEGRGEKKEEKVGFQKGGEEVEKVK